MTDVEDATLSKTAHKKLEKEEKATSAWKAIIEAQTGLDICT